jgi:hypothetical protein
LIAQFKIYRLAIQRAYEAEERLREVQTQLTDMQRRTNELFDENQRLIAQSFKDREDSLLCREKVADWIASQSGLRPVFGHPFEAKAPVDTEPIMGAKRQARDIVTELENDFFRDMRAAENRVSDAMVNNA